MDITIEFFPLSLYYNKCLFHIEAPIVIRNRRFLIVWEQ